MHSKSSVIPSIVKSAPVCYNGGMTEFGFFRVAAASPKLAVADCQKNAAEIVAAAKTAAGNGARLVVFPELCVTGYTCGDLFLQVSLQQAALAGVNFIKEETAALPAVCIVGFPFKHESCLYNCAAVLFGGKVVAIVPKTHIPNYKEFYEARYFVSAEKIRKTVCVDFVDEKNAVPFGTNIIIQDQKNPLLKIGVEICEDLWAVRPPSVCHALHGASVIANLSASNEVIGKAEYRRLLVKAQSARTMTAYIYADAGQDESSGDLIFAGHNLIAENGTVLAESNLFSAQTSYADVDLEKLSIERGNNITFATESNATLAFDESEGYAVLKIDFPSHGNLPQSKVSQLVREIEPQPFVPGKREARHERCAEIIAMQSHALAKRLRHIRATNVVVGISGGLDSTLALLVTARAFDLCGLGRENIYAVTMPCFGTTDRTYTNACQLSEKLGASLRQINIADSVRLHLRDIGHDESVHDTTYENAQARERTQVLMDLANKTGGIVIGTGDLSELALGWCTYNGDQMSMYGVNSSIPKTLVRHLVAYFKESFGADDSELRDILQDILDTPVSPELLPPDDSGKIVQKTEDIVGPYELHDFFLYYVLRFGFSPKKIFFLAKQAFCKTEEQKSELPVSFGSDCDLQGVYTAGEIKKWLRNFYVRFFSQQFKRSCMPDGAKVGTVSLSPRGDWRMPSDTSANVWLKEIDALAETD